MIRKDFSLGDKEKIDFSNAKYYIDDYQEAQKTGQIGKKDFANPAEAHRLMNNY